MTNLRSMGFFRTIFCYSHILFVQGYAKKFDKNNFWGSCCSRHGHQSKIFGPFFEIFEHEKYKIIYKYYKKFKAYSLHYFQRKSTYSSVLQVTKFHCWRVFDIFKITAFTLILLTWYITSKTMSKLQTTDVAAATIKPPFKLPQQKQLCFNSTIDSKTNNYHRQKPFLTVF